MYSIVTQRMMRSVPHYKEAIEDAEALAKDGNIVAVYNDREDAVYESHPNECLFCDNLKSFCICDDLTP
jgi:hypothetical protein